MPRHRHVLKLDDFAAWYEMVRRRRGKTCSPETVRTKRQHLEAAARAIGARSTRELAEALGSRERVEAIFRWHFSRHQPGSIRPAYEAYKTFITYAVEAGWIEAGALLPQDRPDPGVPKQISVYSDAETERLLTTARETTDLRFASLLTFLAMTGRRIGEARSLQWDWLHLEEESPYFDLPWQKNGRPQLIPIGPRLQREVFNPAVMESLRNDPKARFKRSPRQFVFPYGEAAVYPRLKKLCSVAGVPYRPPHNHRHTFVTRQIINRTPLEAVSSLVGHSNSRITAERYLHVTAMTYRQYAL
jgi:integrase